MEEEIEMKERGGFYYYDTTEPDGIWCRVWLGKLGFEQNDYEYDDAGTRELNEIIRKFKDEGVNPRELGGNRFMLKQALRYWKNGDVEGVLMTMSNEHSMGFVVDNLSPLKRTGKYEEALFEAYMGIRTNYSKWSMDMLRFLFAQANKEKLRATGDPVPKKDSFKLYRGVSGRGRQRRVNGFSWTESPNTAAWFAERFSYLPDPAVFTVTVPNESVMIYVNERNEQEFILRLPLPCKPKRLREMPEAFLSTDKT